MVKKGMDFFVGVRLNKKLKTHLFSFDSEKNMKSFVKDLKKRSKDVEFIFGKRL